MAALLGWIGRVPSVLGAIGGIADANEDLRLRRGVFLTAVVLSTAAAFLWSALLAASSELAGVIIPLAYATASTVGLVVLPFTRSFDAFRIIQLACWLVLPFAESIVLGGSDASGAIFVWAFTAPLTAVAVLPTRQALVWFAGYLALVVANGALEPVVARPPHLPPQVVHGLAVLNIAGVSLVTFIVLTSFVTQRERAYRVVRRLFGQYLSPAIVRELISDPTRGELGGALTEVTALFADLQGFTTLSERRSPREVVALLNRYFGAIVPIIDHEGGTIIQFAGDAVVAVFNAPIPQQRHALHAARTALAMQSAIAELAKDEPDQPRFRIGMSTGAALVGNVGGAELRNFVANGDAVNLAARLQTSAQAGSIVISETTYALIRDLAVVRPLGRLRLKGKTEEIQAFILEDLREE